MSEPADVSVAPEPHYPFLQRGLTLWRAEERPVERWMLELALMHLILELVRNAPKYRDSAWKEIHSAQAELGMTLTVRAEESGGA